MLVIDQISVKKQNRVIIETPVLKVVKNERVGILGPNGAGKSSLLKVMCGEWVPSQGQVRFHDKRIEDWDRRVLACHMGVLPQSSQVDFPFTAFEIVSIGATPLTLRKRELPHAIRRFMKKTDVLHLENQFYSQLSGGEKQRVHLARVLFQLSQAELSPLLLMDEPTSAQDLGHQHDLMALVDSLCLDHNFTSVSILHDLNLASRYCTEVWIIDQHKIQKTGSPDFVLLPENVQSYWQYLPEKVSCHNQNFGLL